MKKIQEYTYKQIESFMLLSLYYSMGVDRIKYYEYNSLLVPRLKKIISRVAKERHNLFSDRNHTTFQNSSEYTSYDIDAIIKMIKRKYEMFGYYEGYKKIVDSIKMFTFDDTCGKKEKPITLNSKSGMGKISHFGMESI